MSSFTTFYYHKVKAVLIYNIKWWVVFLTFRVLYLNKLTCTMPSTAVMDGIYK